MIDINQIFDKCDTYEPLDFQPDITFNSGITIKFIRHKRVNLLENEFYEYLIPSTLRFDVSQHRAEQLAKLNDCIYPIKFSGSYTCEDVDEKVIEIINTKDEIIVVIKPCVMTKDGLNKFIDVMGGIDEEVITRQFTMHDKLLKQMADESVSGLGIPLKMISGLAEHKEGQMIDFDNVFNVCENDTFVGFHFKSGHFIEISRSTINQSTDPNNPQYEYIYIFPPRYFMTEISIANHLIEMASQKKIIPTGNVLPIELATYHQISFDKPLDDDISSGTFAIIQINGIQMKRDDFIKFINLMGGIDMIDEIPSKRE